MSWEEREGIIGHPEPGKIEVGFFCARCGVYWTMTLPQDDFNPDSLEDEKCYACCLRDRVAFEIKKYRKLKKIAIESMREMANDFDKEVETTRELLQKGSQIINKQDEVIRNLKKVLDKHLQK